MVRGALDAPSDVPETILDIGASEAAAPTGGADGRRASAGHPPPAAPAPADADAAANGGCPACTFLNEYGAQIGICICRMVLRDRARRYGARDCSICGTRLPGAAAARDGGTARDRDGAAPDGELRAHAREMMPMRFIGSGVELDGLAQRSRVVCPSCTYDRNEPYSITCKMCCEVRGAGGGGIGGGGDVRGAVQSLPRRVGQLYGGMVVDALPGDDGDAQGDVGGTRAPAAAPRDGACAPGPAERTGAGAIAGAAASGGGGGAGARANVDIHSCMRSFEYLNGRSCGGGRGS